MSHRLYVRAHGRVQGVSYRAGVAAQARRLQLTGWVRNCRDGHVELLAEGSEAALQELLAWCRKGPILARVESLDIDWSDEAAEFPSFAIAPDA
jgi:acylphosphatase